MQSLIHRARSFPRHVATQADRYAAFARGQQPAALFIACSDSRVVPAHITGAEPGDLFELRTAGNVVPPFDPGSTCAVGATLQYAVEVLAVTDVVICGHTHCGAVRALAGTPPLDDLPLVDSWLAGSRRGDIAAASRPPAVDAPLDREAENHLRTQLKHLVTYPFVGERTAARRLRLHGWIYAVDTGVIRAHQPRTDTFAPL